MSCGHAGCCDSSQHKHATPHVGSTGRAVVKSSEPGEAWGWCYADQIFFDEL